MINFNDLPCDLKSIIFTINREDAKDKKYKDNYNNFVKNFKNRVEGDAVIYNDIIYNWKNHYNRDPLPAHLSHREYVMDEIEAITGQPIFILDMKDIKSAIDDGYVLNL